MPFDLYGTFTRVHNWAEDRNAGIRIIATRMDEEFTNFAQGLSNTITRDGKGKPNVHISWNGKKITNLANPEDDQDAATKYHVTQETTSVYGTAKDFPKRLLHKRDYAAIHSDFNFIPFKVNNVFGDGRVEIDESISHAAFRTEVVDNPQTGQVVYVAPWGNDTTGTGSRNAPYREISKALTSTTLSLIRVFCNIDGSPGKYAPFSLRADTNAAGCAKLRVIEAVGPIDIEYPSTVDISIDNVATGTHGIAGGFAVTDGDSVTVNGEVYTFKNVATAYNHIPIVGGEGRLQWSQRIAAAVNQYSPYCRAVYSGTIGGLTTVTFTARTPGLVGNSITLATASTNPIFSVSGANLTGGGPGWTAEGNGVYYRDLNVAFEAPRAVFLKNLPVKDGVHALSWYGNRVDATFTGQPAAGDTITVNSGYLGTARTITFAVGGAVSITNCPIGATLSDTLTNLCTCINSNSFLFGLSANHNGTVVRLWQRMGSTATINVTEVSAALSIGALVLAKDALINLDNADPAFNTTFRNLSIGGWTYDSATGRLRVKIIGGAEISPSSSALSLVSGTSAAGTRMLVAGGRLLLRGNIQFRNTYLYLINAADPVTYPTRVYVDLTNPPDRPAGLFTPQDVGSLETIGTQAILGNAVFNNTSIDAFHPTGNAKIATVNGGSAFAGDAMSFPQMEFPNRNGLSPHGAASVTAVLGGVFSKAVGPLLTGEGKFLIAGVVGRESIGVTNRYGFLALADCTAYIDTCTMIDNNENDFKFDGSTGVTYGYITKGQSVSGAATAWVPPFVA